MHYRKLHMCIVFFPPSIKLYVHHVDSHTAFYKWSMSFEYFASTCTLDGEIHFRLYTQLVTRVVSRCLQPAQPVPVNSRAYWPRVSLHAQVFKTINRILFTDLGRAQVGNTPKSWSLPVKV